MPSVVIACPLVEELNASATHHRIIANGIAMHWCEWGHGKPLVLLHGGHGSWMHWARNVQALAKHYRVLVPDMPGFGASEDFALPPHDPSRLEALLQALEGSLTALIHQQNFYLAGFSFGGAMAGLLAARMPRVDRLILLGSGGHGGPRREKAPQLNWRVEDPQARAAALRQNLAVFMLSGEEAIDEEAIHIHTASCEATRFRSKGISRNAVLPEALQTYDRPLLLVWGEEDVTAVPMEAAERLQQGRPERDWTIISNAGHWVQYERPDAVNALMLRWLGDHAIQPA